MRAFLLYNPTAGTAKPIEAIEERLGQIGWTVAGRRGIAQLDEARIGFDVIVVAGGDGTVGRVAKRLAGTNVPVAIVPMGTANNVARSLGIPLDAIEAAGALVDTRERCVDLGEVRSSSESERFLEGFGVGALAYVFGEVVSHEHKKRETALEIIADQVDAYTPRRSTIEADGRDLSGVYLLVAVMNMRSMGPALGLAPAARCDDGALDLVLVPPEAKRALVAHLRRAVAAPDDPPPIFDGVRARHVRVQTDDKWVHVDASAYERSDVLTVDVLPRAVRILVPATSGPRATHARART